MQVSVCTGGTFCDMEPMDEKHLLAAFERATAHQNRALAALGHPTSSMGKTANSTAAGEHDDASESCESSANERAALQTPNPTRTRVTSHSELREPAAPGAQ